MSKGRYYVIAIVGVIMAGVGLYLVKAVSIPQGIMKTLPFIMSMIKSIRVHINPSILFDDFL